MKQYRSDAVSVIKQIRIQDVFERYGIKIKNGKGYCPFHNDTNTPNLSLKYNRFYCFACGEKGDAIDFVQKYFGLEMKAAIKKLSDDFGLGLDTSVPYRVDYTIRQKRRNEEAFKEWVIKENAYLTEIYRTVRLIAKSAEEITMLILLEHYLDMLCGSKEEKMEIYEHRKEVERFATRLKDGYYGGLDK